MILAYSYRHFPDNTPSLQQRVIDFYKLSMFKAKQLGYEVHMFTDVPEMWEADKIVICNPDHRKEFFDSYKMYALSRLEEDYMLIDGDVILNKRFEIGDEEVIYDADELADWKSYRKYIKELDKLGIKEVIPEWNPNRLIPKCCGLLRIKSDTLKSLYYHRWNDFYRFAVDKYDKVPWQLTGVAAEYLLTCLIDYYNISHKALSNELGTQNNTYRHYCGELKLQEDLIDLNIDNYKASSLI